MRILHFTLVFGLTLDYSMPASPLNETMFPTSIGNPIGVLYDRNSCPEAGIYPLHNERGKYETCKCDRARGCYYDSGITNCIGRCVAPSVEGQKYECTDEGCSRLPKYGEVPPGIKCSKNAFFPVPSEPGHYYHCHRDLNHWMAHKLRCQTTTCYNPKTNQCDNNSCDHTTTTTTTPTTSTTKKPTTSTTTTTTTKASTATTLPISTSGTTGTGTMPTTAPTPENGLCPTFCCLEVCEGRDTFCPSFGEEICGETLKPMVVCYSNAPECVQCVGPGQDVCPTNTSCTHGEICDYFNK